MPEQIEKLKSVVRELENELRALPAVDEQASEVLQEALREIQSVLLSRQGGPAAAAADSPIEQAESEEAESVMDRLRHAAHQFEGSHPTLTGLLSRLIDGLGQMGI
jgi:hypothetical protein